LVIDGQLIGLIDRSKILSSQSPKIRSVKDTKIAVESAEAIPAHSTIREAVAKMVENSMSLLVVLSTTEDTPIGIVTLHDETSFRMRLHFSWAELLEGLNLTNRTILTLLTTVAVEDHDDVKKKPPHERL
jgi:hypothetical protein